ncbi:hypothetical protein IEQ34_003621 [Dendrobium chrysotoxum]|uniref:Uncharacterized protein n=1 Tax=Dendrobium chrysotoxum TaxID=161865 RepID=A0AAV7HM57_DENCH|nr:hypothetical protein IEQ34_003621 [Dendrobium chrysotoxum]
MEKNTEEKEEFSCSDEISSLLKLAALGAFVWGVSRCFSSSSNEKMMRAPGRPNEYIRRDDFVSNPKDYFSELRKKLFIKHWNPLMILELNDLGLSFYIHKLLLLLLKLSTIHRYVEQKHSCIRCLDQFENIETYRACHQAKFSFPANIRHWILQSLGVKWRNYKTSLKERATRNIKNVKKKKQMCPHEMSQAHACEMLAEERLMLEDRNLEANEKVFKAIIRLEHPWRVRTQGFGISHMIVFCDEVCN